MKTQGNHIESDERESYDRPLENLFIAYAAVLPVSISAANIVLFMIMVLGFYRVYKARINVLSVLDKKLALACISLFSWAAIVALVRNGHIQKSDISNIWEYSPIIVFPLFLSVAKIRKEKVIYTLLLFASIVCLLGILQIIFPSIVYPFPKQPGRINYFGSQPFFLGFQSHHLHAAGVYGLTTILALTLATFFRQSGKKRIVLWAFFFINLVALSLTMARSYYVALLAVIPVLMYMRSRLTFFVGSTVMALIVVLVISFHSGINTRARSIFDTNNSSNNARIVLWLASLEMVKDYPFLGVGKSNWKEEAKETYLPRIGAEWSPVYGHAHNIYFVWLSETGTPGLLFFLLFWGVTLKKLVAKLSQAEIGSFEYSLILSGVFGAVMLAVAGMFENNFETSMILLVIGPLIGLALSGEEKKIRII